MSDVIDRAIAAAAANADEPRGVEETLATRPRPSSRPTTWERRGNVALVSDASAVIRSVRAGASESIARTW